MYSSLGFSKFCLVIFGGGFSIVTFAAGLGLTDEGHGLLAFFTFMAAATLVYWTVVAYLAALRYEEEAEHRQRRSRDYIQLLQDRIRKGSWDEVETR